MYGAKGESDGIWPRRFYECGPLVLDGMQDRAFIYDEDLSLTEEEYVSLFLLSQQENQTMTFEQLYKAVWEPAEDDSDRREAARRGIDNVVKQLNVAGKGILWIEVQPENRFVLRLKQRRGKSA